MYEVNWDSLESIPTPGPKPAGLTWDGSTLWISDEEKHKNFRINPEKKRPQYSFNCHGVPAGLSWDGKHLWQADMEDKKISKLTRNGRLVEVINIFQVDKPAGLAYFNDVLWQADYSGLWYRINVAEEKIEGTFKWGSNVCGIVHDGDEFWYLEDSTPALHQISQFMGTNRKSCKIEGIPRGLAWDGEQFWIADAESQSIKRIDPGKITND